VNLLILVPAALLLTLGAEGLYHAFVSRESVAIDCGEFAHVRPRSHRLLITGCEIDYTGSGYRESDGEVQEIYLPARPRGRAIPAPIVVAIRDGSVLSAFHSAKGGGALAPQQSMAVMEKVAGRLQVTRVIDGLARAGYVERLRSRRILSGLTTAVAEDAVILDVHGTPDFIRPLLSLAAGIVLAALPFIRRGPRPAAAAPDQNTVSPSVPATVAALPKLLLLKLDVNATPDAVETAPPLGPRDELIQILSGVVPDLEVNQNRQLLMRPDGSLTLDLGAHDPVPTVVVDARGEAGVALVKEVLLMTGWRAFAPKTGLFVTVDDLTALGALAATES
jgi:hypothetical protein